MTYVNVQQYTIKRTLLRSSIKRFINAVGRDFNIYFLNFVLMFDQIILKKYLLIDQYHMKQVVVNILEVWITTFTLK